MHYTPRTIAFHTDLVHPPAPVDPGPIQRVHNRLFASSEPLYRNFHVTPKGPVLANQGESPGRASQVAFLADRVRFVEEGTGLTIEEFAGRVTRIIGLVGEERPYPLFAAQQVTIRTLVNPRNYPGGLEFLRDGLLGARSPGEEFGREPGALGLRLAFGMQPDRPQAFAVRIESLPADPRSLLLENQGTFGPIAPAGGPATQAGQGLEPLEQNILTTYSFATNELLRFLARFETSNDEDSA